MNHENSLEHPRELARRRIFEYHSKFSVLLIIGWRPRGQKHQVWPIDGLFELLKDHYVAGVYL